VNKKRIKRRKMWLGFSAISLIVFVLLVAEFICGLWLHHNYKTQSIYGKNTYIAYVDGEKLIKYGDYKKIDLDLSVEKITCVEVSGDGELKFRKYDADAGVLPNDDDYLITNGVIWDAFFDNIFFEKYKDHMWFYVTAYVDVYETEGNSDYIDSVYIYGSDSIVSKGRMCSHEGECVVSEGYSIGDKIELMDRNEHVTGVIKSENILIPNAYGIIGAIYMYNGYDKYLKPDYQIVRSYDEFLALKQPGKSNVSSAINSYYIDKVIFDRSAISEEDLESLKAITIVKSLKAAYGRYATVYVYLFVAFPIISLLALIACIKRLKMTFCK